MSMLGYDVIPVIFIISTFNLIPFISSQDPVASTQVCELFIRQAPFRPERPI